MQCFFNWSQIKREKPGDKAGKHPQFLRYWRMRTETLVSEMTSGSWFFQKDCTLQMLVVQSFESLLKFPCYSQRYFSLLGWQLCANLNLNMLITFKTLQQQTFKLEIDDTATVGTKLTNLKGLSICTCILYGSELRHDLLTTKFSIVLPRNIDFLSYRVTFLYVCVKLCEDFSLKMSFRRHAFKNLLQPKNHLYHHVLQSTFNDKWFSVYLPHWRLN